MHCYTEIVKLLKQIRMLLDCDHDVAQIFCFPFHWIVSMMQ